MNILTEADFTISKWNGGTTTQLFISPEGSTLTERNFDWRISSAVIETEESEFTLFEGYERMLIPLQGKLQMEHQTPNGVLEQHVAEFQLARFSGSWPTKGKGKLTDFNLIFRPSYHPKVHVTHFSEETVVIPEEKTDVLFLQSGTCKVNARLIHAPALLLIDEQEEVRITCFANSRIISIEMDLVG